MSATRTIDLTSSQRAIVADILASVRGRIGEVKVYGSRATGRARPGSDLDLVVFPPAPQTELDELRLAFEESFLPIAVDVVAWDDIASPRMREEIERDALPWYTDGC